MNAGEKRKKRKEKKQENKYNGNREKDEKMKRGVKWDKEVNSSINTAHTPFLVSKNLRSSNCWIKLYVRSIFIYVHTYMYIIFCLQFHIFTVHEQIERKEPFSLSLAHENPSAIQRNEIDNAKRIQKIKQNIKWWTENRK